jgi:2-oxoglutarate dehydrogenase E1 component
MSSSKNTEFEKTSFLNKSNSAFIEQMYLKFINKDSDYWRAGKIILRALVKS